MSEPSGNRAAGSGITQNRGHVWTILVMVAILVLFFYICLGNPSNIFFPPGSDYSDLLITHWPNANFFKKSVLIYHQWPLWNPEQMLGVSFAANPLSGLWYPPNWLLLILPVTAGLNALMLGHLCLGGLGMLNLLKRMDAGPYGRLAGGLAWSLAPKIWAHLGAGHVGLVFAAGWLPWVAGAVYQTAQGLGEEGSERWRGVRRLGLYSALQFLADPRLSVYTLLGTVLTVGWWALSRRAREQFKMKSGVRNSDDQTGSRSLSWTRQYMVPWLVAGFFFLALTAVLWIPLADYVPFTNRPELTEQESAVLSLPPLYLLGMVWADLGGFHEWMTYCGVSILMLGILGWFRLSRPGRWGVLLGFLVLILFSLGDITPIYRLFLSIPGASLLRVPPRIWFLVSFLCALLAGLGVAELECGETSLVFTRNRRWLNRIAVAMTGGMLAWSIVIAINRPTRSAWIAPVWFVLVMALGWAIREKRFGLVSGSGLLIALVVVELGWMDSTLVVSKCAESVFAEGAKVSGVMRMETGRIYAPSFLPGAHIASFNKLRVVNGVDPIIPLKYSTFINQTSGNTQKSPYSVTLPALNLEDTDVTLALQDRLPNPHLLSILDVEWVVASFPIDSPDLEPIYEKGIDGLRLYRNSRRNDWPAVFQHVELARDFPGVLARLSAGDGKDVAIVTDGPTLDGPNGRFAAELLQITPNELRISARGPGLLVVSELDAPGWRAWVDEKPQEIVTVDGILRGVYLDRGNHIVQMRYRPKSVWFGLSNSLIAIVLLIAWRATERRQ